MISLSFSYRLAARFTTLIAVVLVAFLSGTADLSHADEIEPEPVTDAPVTEEATPADQPASTPSTAAKEPASHVHEVNPAPRRSAREVVEEIWNREKLSGNWGGLREDLSDHGISIGGRLSHFYQSVSSGGADKNDEYGGKMDYRLHADGQKALGLWQGLSFDLHAETRWGQDIMADAGGITLPNAGLLTPLPGDYSDSDITGLQFTQVFLEGRVAVFGGKLNVIDLETAMVPTTANGQEGFWTVNGLATGWTWLRFVNIAMYGGGAMVMNPERGMVEGALIAFGQSNVSDRWDIDDSFDDGVGFLGAWRFFWDLGDLPGNIIVAAGGATKGYQSLEASPWTVIPGSDFVDFIIMLPNLSNNKKKPWAATSYVYQELWNGGKGDPRKVYLFVGGSLADKNPSFARWTAFGSIEAIGPLSIRPADRLGFAGWYTAVNDDIKDLLGGLPAAIAVNVGDSWGLELYYNVAVNRWLHITGDLQVVQNANKSDDVAVIPGVRVVVDF